MVKRIRWSPVALKSREDILEYWELKTGTKTYSIKLAKVFQLAVSNIKEFNKIGKSTNKLNVRRYVINNYSLYYIVEKTEIRILLIRDNRRNPKDLKLN